MSGEDFSVPQGSIALMLLNVYSSLILKTYLSTVIFDPVRINLNKPRFNVQDIDAIIITHEHSDHFDKKVVLEMQRESKAAVITTPYVAQKLEGIRGKVKGLKVGESVMIKDIAFYAEYCDHTANQPLSFIIKTGAITIYHPDDSKPFPGMRELEKRYRPDMVLYIATSKEGLIKIAEIVRPNIVVSYFDPRFADLKIPGVELKMVRQFEIFRYP